MSAKGQQFLLIYSAVLSTVFGVVLLTGANAPENASFGDLTVHRINVVEPDGTLRMVISNHARLPGIIVKGKEKAFARPQAGMLFYNDEASEAGGLIFGGHLNDKGEVVDSGGSLSFDKYGANQIVQIAGVDDKEDRFAGLAVSDSNRRVWVGRSDDGTASVSLMDAGGRKRIVMQVAPDGTPSLVFLDDQGKIIQRVDAAHNNGR